MLVKNNEPRARAIGNIYLIPGINHVDDARWEHALKIGYQKAVDGMINESVIEVTDEKQKLTIEMVRNTYEINLLEEWLANPKHKGPLKGALKKQLQLMEVDAVAGE